MLLKDEARQEETNGENNAGNREKNEPENAAPLEEVVELDVAGWWRLAEISEEQQRCADDESEHAQPSRCEPHESHSFLFASEVKKKRVFRNFEKIQLLIFSSGSSGEHIISFSLKNSREKREKKAA